MEQEDACVCLHALNVKCGGNKALCAFLNQRQRWKRGVMQVQRSFPQLDMCRH